jgi:hypothetical protein
LSIAANPEGEVLHLSENTEDIFIVEVDFNFVNRTRTKGFMGLGQNLKSYRDKPVHDEKNINRKYLDSLGDLKKFSKD